MTAHRTEAQKLAARENGKKSRGPKTEAGKRKSCRNSTKDGLSPGAGKVLPEPLAADVDRQVTAFLADFLPRSAYERSLVRTAAVGYARLVQLTQAETALTQSRLRHAIDDWDDARNAEIARLAALLPDDPQAALHGLRRTAEGCDFLADAWDLLLETFNETAEFDDASRTHAAHLLGHAALDCDSLDLRLRRLSCVCMALDEKDAEAPAELAAFLQSCIDEYTKRGDDLWERLDAPDRAAAPRRAYFDASPEGQRLARYIAAAERTWRRALQELAAARSAWPESRRAPAPAAAAEPAPQPPSPEPAPAQNEPSAAQAPVAQASAPQPRRDPLARDLFDDPTSRVSFVPISIGNGNRQKATR